MAVTTGAGEMWRVTTLAMRCEGLDTAEFETRWIGALAPAVAEFVAADPRARRVVLNVAPKHLDPAVRTVFPPAYDGLIEFWFGTPQDAAAAMRRLAGAEELALRAADVVDGPRGVAWLAKVVPAKLDSGSTVKFLAGGDVAEGVTLKEAHRYWAEDHPRVAQTAPAVWDRLTRYTQFHGTPDPAIDPGRWLAVGRFVPMCSDMGFARAEDFVALYTSSDYARIVRPDEEKFSRPGEMLSFVSAEERVLFARDETAVPGR